MRKTIFASAPVFFVFLFFIACSNTPPPPPSESNKDGGTKEASVEKNADGGSAEKPQTEAPPPKEDDGIPYHNKPCTNHQECKGPGPKYVDYGYRCYNSVCTKSRQGCDGRTEAARHKNVICAKLAEVCVQSASDKTAAFCEEPNCHNAQPGNFTAGQTRCRAPGGATQKCKIGQILMGYLVCLNNGNAPECRDKDGGDKAYECVTDTPW